MRRIVAVVASAVLCSGCFGSVLQSGQEPPDLYRLAPPPGADGEPALAWAISVPRPRASSSLDTQRIAVVLPGHRFDYLADARWADAAPQMVQQMLVAALGPPGGFSTAVAAPSRVPVDLLLDTELRRFEAVYAGVDEAPTVVVEMRASLVDGRKGARVASFDSRAEVTAARNDRGAVVSAFEQAAGKVVADVAGRARSAAANLPR